MRTRLMLLALVALGLAPGLWLRSAQVPIDRHAPISVTGLPLETRQAGELRIVRAWWLSGDTRAFGGFSALVPLGRNRLLAVSDAAEAAIIDVTGVPRVVAMRPYGPVDRDKRDSDIEAVTRDPRTGRLWAAYEGTNRIERRKADLTGARDTRPAQMADWPSNKGPEAMARLADGRFLVISESRGGREGETFDALLFDRDPVEDAKALPFRLHLADGYRPTDAATLPDGRVLILARAVSWRPPGFRARLFVADPAAIQEGEVWRGRMIAAFAPPVPVDNFEGLAVLPNSQGATGYPVTIWMISDDNQLNLFQRTLLLEMRWRG